MSKYTSAEIQQVINDLDYAQVFFANRDGEPIPDLAQVHQSLKNASDILCYLPDEVIEDLEKTRDVFVLIPASKGNLTDGE